MAHAQRRQFDEAIAEFEKGFALSTRRVLMVSVLGTAMAQRDECPRRSRSSRNSATRRGG